MRLPLICRGAARPKTVCRASPLSAEALAARAAAALSAASASRCSPCDAYMHRGRGGVESSRQIALSLDELRHMRPYFESQWHRQPTPAEFQAMVEDKVREEVLYREALAMGLDKDDTIVKRRMAQKMQFLAEDRRRRSRAFHRTNSRPGSRRTATSSLCPAATASAISTFPLTSAARTHRTTPPRRSTKIAGQPEDSKLAVSLADRFMFQDYYGDRTPEAMAKEFGPQFAVALEKLKPGSWQGPIESGYGWHLVFVDTVIPGRIPAFEEMEPDVKTAWLGEQKRQAWQRPYQRNARANTRALARSPDKEAAAQTPAPRTRRRRTSPGFFR